MALTHSVFGPLPWGGKGVKSYDGPSDNAQLTVQSPTITAGARQRARRLIGVLVQYSAAVTKSPTVTYKGSHGASFASLLNTIVITAAQSGSFFPTQQIPLSADDYIEVVAPASGAGGTTCSVTILTEEF